MLAAALASIAPRAGRAEVPKLGVSVTFANAEALDRYRAYVEFLSSDPARFEAELATIDRLERSDVQYVIRICGACEGGVEGSLTTDGDRIFINVSNTGSETASLNSRLAHELEHARQFDAGEIAFTRDRKDGNWKPARSSYDIGDEVKAWDAQVRASTPKDYWLVTDRKRKPTLLQLFAQATTPERQAEVLRQHGYDDRKPEPDSDVVFPDTAGFVAGQVIRPTYALAFFGRVRRICHSPS
jgi:hypothetical protein